MKGHKGRFKLSTLAKCTLSKGKTLIKSLKIQNFLRPGSQILAYKTMLLVFVVRTLTWCSQIMEMWNIHTAWTKTNQQQQKSKRQRLRYISQNDRLPLLSLFACFHWKLREGFYSLGMILDQRFLESTNPDRIG